MRKTKPMELMKRYMHIHTRMPAHTSPPTAAGPPSSHVHAHVHEHVHACMLVPAHLHMHACTSLTPRPHGRRSSIDSIVDEAPARMVEPFKLQLRPAQHKAMGFECACACSYIYVCR